MSVIAVTLSGLAWSRHLWFSVAAVALQSVAIATSLGLVSIIIQEMVPDELRGRVMSLYSLMFMGVMPFASLLVTRMVDAIGMRWELQIAAVVYGQFPSGVGNGAIILKTVSSAGAVVDSETVTPSGAIDPEVAALADGRFIIGESSRLKGFVMAGGCNAHGISGSGGIGKLLVESLLDPKPSSYVKSLSPDRFTETDWDWETARSQAARVYETYYGV
jgi:MFS family permease